MASSVWSGYLTFGLISMPVRLFSGARGSHISFHMLHRDDNTRIKQQLWCPHDERVVERSEIVKGYEYRKGEYVIIEPEEIKKIEPKTAKAMEILEFVKADDVDPIYFESSYFLVPEDAGKRPYALLSKALEETNYVAIAKLTMHNREYTVFLRPYKGGMMLHTMYYKNEVKDLDNFGRPDVELKDAEVKVAHQLIEALDKRRGVVELTALGQRCLIEQDVTPVREPADVRFVLQAIHDRVARVDLEDGLDGRHLLTRCLQQTLQIHAHAVLVADEAGG